MNKENKKEKEFYKGEYEEELEEMFKKDEDVLNEVKKIVSKNKFKKIKEKIQEDGGFKFEIKDNFEGELDDCRNDRLKVYVNQTQNGGYEGDSYAGDIYIQISENKYFKFSYAM